MPRCDAETYMQLLAPWMALVGLAVIPPVVALYFLKLKRKAAVVSSTYLWRQSLQDLRVNAPFQRLKRSLLLILQLLVLAAALIALVRPVVRWQGIEGQNHVLVIDVSASMGARDVAPSRLEAAKAEARRVVDGLARGDRVMVVAFADQAQVACPLTADKSEIRRAVDSLRVRETRTAADEALRIAVSIAERHPPAAITILSDGAFEAGADLPPHRTPIRFVPVGDPAGARNVGIVALEARRPYGGSADYHLFAAVRNGGKARETFTLEIRHGETLVDARPMSLDPGEERSCIYDRPGLSGGWVQVSVDLADAVDADNRAWAVLALERRPRILYVAREDRFLERALRVIPTRAFTSMEPEAFTAAAAGGTIAWRDYDVVVADGAAAAALPPEAPNLLWFGGAPPIEGFAARERVQRPPVVDWNRTHPVMRSVNFGTVSVAESARLEVPPWAETLVESASGPLIAAAETARRRVVLAGFSPLDSDWPLRIAFPLFVSNAVAWLAAGPGGASDAGPAACAPAIATGDVLRIAAAPGTRSVEVTPPAGGPVRVDVGEGGQAVFAATARAGLYRVRDDKGAVWLAAANLLNRQETDVVPRPAVAFGSDRREAVSTVVESNREIWKLAVWSALVLLAAEWLVYTLGLAR